MHLTCWYWDGMYTCHIHFHSCLLTVFKHKWLHTSLFAKEAVTILHPIWEKEIQRTLTYSDFKSGTHYLRLQMYNAFIVFNCNLLPSEPLFISFLKRGLADWSTPVSGFSWQPFLSKDWTEYRPICLTYLLSSLNFKKQKCHFY